MINLSSVGELSVAVSWSSSGYFSYYAYWSVKKQATLKATPSSAVVLQSQDQHQAKTMPTPITAVKKKRRKRRGKIGRRAAKKRTCIKPTEQRDWVKHTIKKPVQKQKSKLKLAGAPSEASMIGVALIRTTYGQHERNIKAIEVHQDCYNQ